MIPVSFIVPEKYNNEKWPKAVAAVPRPGVDYIESMDGVVLPVRTVIHSTSQIEGIRQKISPIIKVVLGSDRCEI